MKVARALGVKFHAQALRVAVEQVNRRVDERLVGWSIIEGSAAAQTRYVSRRIFAFEQAPRALLSARELHARPARKVDDPSTDAVH